MEVYPGPFPGSVRDTELQPFPLPDRNQIVQHRNPADHIEVLETIRTPPRHRARPGRNLASQDQESAFIQNPVQNVLSPAMNGPALAGLRNIMSTWTSFQMNHPVASRTVKCLVYFFGASAATGGSVMLSTEVSKILREQKMKTLRKKK